MYIITLLSFILVGSLALPQWGNKFKLFSIHCYRTELLLYHGSVIFSSSSNGFLFKHQALGSLPPISELSLANFSLPSPGSTVFPWTSCSAHSSRRLHASILALLSVPLQYFYPQRSSMLKLLGTVVGLDPRQLFANPCHSRTRSPGIRL
jgi:hypothetical protein